MSETHSLFEHVAQLVSAANHIVVLQAENPDADSLGSALALEEILSEMGKKVSLYCAVDMPKYLRYAKGWDRVESDFPHEFDLSIVVDASVQSLFTKMLTAENASRLNHHPLIIFDHHASFNAENHLDQRFSDVTTINQPSAVATGELLYDWAHASKLVITTQAAESMTLAIMGDSLGLTTEATSAHTLRVVSELMDLGVKLSDLEQRRREFMKKSPEILYYKGELLQRVEYFADGQLALVHIPWNDIEKYSDQFNPSVLVIDEMRLVEGVRVAVALKTYPDGKITAKIRCNPGSAIADKIGSHFGAGGHPYAAGFKVFTEDFLGTKRELIKTVADLLAKCDTAEPC
jgi:bifunctional oligoribonuclease and PAP phosphatase NrnA